MPTPGFAARAKTGLPHPADRPAMMTAQPIRRGMTRPQSRNTGMPPSGEGPRVIDARKS